MIEQKETKKKKFIVRKFFFPFYPIKSFYSVRLLFIMAILLALRLTLGILTIRVAPLALSISIAWVPVMVLGWYFGPIIGLVFGILTDTISFLMAGGGIWFWMYAIQEPIVGFLSGLLAGLCQIRKAKQNIVPDIIINQILLLAFAALSYITLIFWLDPNVQFEGQKPQYEQFYEIYRWVVVVGVSILVAVYETLIITTMVRKKQDNDHKTLINFVYTSSLVVVCMLLFSIALGPITAVEYLKFIGVTPEQFIKYGSVFYLIPRIAIESIKVPIEIFCLFGVVCLFDKKIVNIINKINNSWNVA